MITEQEVLDHINNGLKHNSLKAETKKYTSKLQTLDSRINNLDSRLEILKKEQKAVEEEILKLKGAFSMLIELSGESEGLLKSEPTSTDNTTIPG